MADFTVHGHFVKRGDYYFRKSAYLQWGASGRSLGCCVLLNPGSATIGSADSNRKAELEEKGETFATLTPDPTMRQLASFLERINTGLIDGRFHIYNLFTLQNTDDQDAIEQYERLSEGGLFPYDEAVISVQELKQHPWVLLGWGVKEHKKSWRYLPKVKERWITQINTVGIPFFGKRHIKRRSGSYYYHPCPQIPTRREPLVMELKALFEQEIRLLMEGKAMHAKNFLKGKLLEKYRLLSDAFPCSDDGYVDQIEHNLFKDVSFGEVKDVFEKGGGNELHRKMRAIHSSSALVVNHFAPFLHQVGYLSILADGIQSLSFEKQVPTGLLGKAPHLDLLLETDNGVVGVESKFLEPCDKKSKPPFASTYFERERLKHLSPFWFDLMKRYNDRPSSHLDVGQLIKHAIGLLKQYQEKAIQLTYLYWSPPGVEAYDEYKEHIKELCEFQHLLQRSEISFRTVTYQELWAVWETKPELTGHVERCKARYDVEI